MESLGNSNILLLLKNSTNTALAGDAVFTGTGISVEHFIQVVLNIVSDQQCATGGVEIQYSVDNATWVTNYTISSLDPEGTAYIKNVSYPVISKYLRIKYTNGSTGQTYFTLNTYVKKYRDPELLGTTGSVISADQTTSIVRIGADYKRDVALGKIYDSRNYIVNGSRALGVLEEETTLSNITAAIYVFPTSAEPVYCVSDDAADTYGTGSGAWVVNVWGLDANFEERMETVNVTGTTNSAVTTYSYIRVNDFRVVAAGSYDSNNVGNIRLFQQTSGIEISAIIAKHGRAINAVYTIPAGHYGIIPRATFMCSQGHTVEFNGWYRTNKLPIAPPYNPIYIINNMTHFTGVNEIKPEELVKFNPMTDFWVTAKKQSGTGSAYVSIIYDLDIIKIT